MQFSLKWYLISQATGWCAASLWIWSYIQGHNKRNIFQRGHSHFSWYEKGSFPVENFHFGRPKTNFSGIEKWKAKKKKEVLSSFCNFSSFHFQFSNFPFSIFLLFCSIFSFFLASLFPVGQQKFPCQKSLGAFWPLPHHYTTGYIIFMVACREVVPQIWWSCFMVHLFLMCLTIFKYLDA